MVLSNLDNFTNNTSPNNSLPINVFLGGLMIINIYTLGFILNIAIIILVFKTEKFKAASDVLIVHLSACDILLCISFLSYSGAIYAGYFMGWPSAIMDPTCKIYTFLLLVSLSLRAYTLTWMSIERYRTIIYSTKPGLQVRNMVAILICTSILLSIVPALGIPNTVADYQIRYTCHYDVHQRYLIVIASLYFLVVCYIIPAIIMFYCYSGIIKKFRQVSWVTLRRRVNRESSKCPKMRVIKILIFISLLFIITGLPLIIGFFLTIYRESNLVNLTATDYDNFNVSNYFIGFLLHISPIYNPVIYFTKKKINCSIFRCHGH